MTIEPKKTYTATITTPRCDFVVNLRPDLAPQTRVVRGEVPTPMGRPYTLGHTVADASSVAATSELSAVRAAPGGAGRLDDAHRATAGASANGALTAPRPVTAYSTTRDPMAGFMSGRGLY
jgi:rare lipoprotein A